MINEGCRLNDQLEHTRHSKDIGSHCLVRKTKVERGTTTAVQTPINQGISQDIGYIKGGGIGEVVIKPR